MKSSTIGEGLSPEMEALITERVNQALRAAKVSPEGKSTRLLDRVRRGLNMDIKDILALYVAYKTKGAVRIS